MGTDFVVTSNYPMCLFYWIVKASKKTREVTQILNLMNLQCCPENKAAVTVNADLKQDTVKSSTL